MAKRNSKGRFIKASRKKRRRNPKRRRAVARVSAPRKRRRSRRTVARVSAPRRRRRRNPRVRATRRSRRRRNPRFSLGGVTSQIMSAGTGALGAIGLDVALGFIPLPDILKTGLPRHGVRLVGALGLGWVAGKALGQRVGQNVAQGAMTVVLYGLIKDLVNQFAPGKIPGLAGGDEYSDIALGYMDPAPWIEDQRGFNAGRDVNNVGAYMEGTGAYMEEGTGAYMDL